MSQQTISAGSQVFVGAPAHPLPAERVRRLSAMLSELAAVEEAHLPQCYIPGRIDPPAQVLMVVLAASADVASTMETIIARLNGMLPEGVHLDVLHLSRQHELLPFVRKAGCVLVTRTRPWWRLW